MGERTEKLRKLVNSEKDSLEVIAEMLDLFEEMEEEVDELNVYEASKVAMTRCVQRMPKTDYVLTDCMPLDIDLPVLSLIKGDSKSGSIAAASILAKVTRDRIMEDLDNEYPQYQFKKHKGYVTKKHLELLEEHGVSPVHRKSFSPVKNVLGKSNK